jgi:hypothetical protein
VEKGCLGYEVVGKKTVGTAPEIIGAFSADDIASEPSAREAQGDHDRKCRDRVGHEDGRDSETWRLGDLETVGGDLISWSPCLFVSLSLGLSVSGSLSPA